MRQQARRYSVFFQLLKQSTVCAVITTLAVSFSLSARPAVAGVNGGTVSRQATAGSRSSRAQTDQKTPLLKPGEPVSREIAGGQAHTYLIKLQPRQFVRVVVEQRGVDVALSLAGPDGQPVAEVNLTRAGALESLSYEVTIGGDYRFTIRALGAATLAGSYQASMELRETATAQDRQRITAERLLGEGYPLYQRGEAQPATEKLEQALPLWREVGDTYWEAYTLNYLGNAGINLSRYEKAIDYFEQALAISRGLKDRGGEGNALNGLGTCWRILGHAEKAIEYFEQAVAIRRETRNRYGEGSTLANLGLAYDDLGRYEKEIELCEQALQIAREVKDSSLEGRALNGLGIALETLGQYEKALEIYEQALKTSREVKNRANEAILTLNLGGVYSSLGRYEKGIEYFERALAINREIKNRNGEGRTLSMLSDSYLALSRFEKAIVLDQEALAIFRETKDRPAEGIVLSHLGDAYLYQSRYEKAPELYQQSLAISREVKDRLGEAADLERLGIVFLSLSRFNEAVRNHEQALFIMRELNAKQGEASVLHNLMVDWQRAQPRLAIFFGKQAVNVNQAMRADIRGLDQESQRSFLKRYEDTYRNLADLLISQGRLPEAQQVLAMLKEEEYFDFVRRDGAEANTLTARATLTADEAALEAEYNRIADEVALLGKQRGELFAKKERTAAEEQQLNKLEDQLAIATDHFQKFLEQLQVKFGSTTAQGARVSDVKDALGMQKTLRELGDGAVLLYTLVGSDKYRMMLVTPDTEQAYENAISGADLARKVMAFREALQDPRTDPGPLARELYGILIGPKLARDLKQAGAKTLMWSLDGVLRYLPVAALQDEQQKYLVESYRNVMFTPASRDRLKDPVAAHWQGLGLGVSKGKRVQVSETRGLLTFKPLPGVPRELRSIINDKTVDQTAAVGEGVLEGRVMLDEVFTKDALRLALRQRYPLVHIASHFMFQPGNETNSFLLLGGMDEQNNKLTIAELKRISFEGVNLLTLSACETAMSGEKANGVEVESFGVLAQRQGAEAVMATLWPVADVSTPLLMREFYRLRESNPGMTKAEALRRAQVALLTGEIKPTGKDNRGPGVEPKADKDNRGLGIEPARADKDNRGITLGAKPAKASFAHPFYWAPFILIGNWK